MGLKQLVKSVLAPPGTLRRRLVRKCQRALYCSYLKYWKHPQRGDRGYNLGEPFVDPYDPALLLQFLAQCGAAAPWTWSAPAAEESVEQAARAVLGILGERPALRRRFPQAVTQEPGGGYRQWLLHEGAKIYGWSAKACANVSEAFERRLGDNVVKAFDHDMGMRQVFPLALLPNGRQQFLHYLLSPHGQKTFGIQVHDIAWFLFEMAEDPWHGVAATYLRLPEWQERFPYALTAFGREEFLDWLASAYPLDDPWLYSLRLSALYSPREELRLLVAGRRDLQQQFPDAWHDPATTGRLLQSLRQEPATRRALPYRQWRELDRDCRLGRLESLGVNVVGHFCYPSGLRQATQAAAAALRRAGVAVSCRDVPGQRPFDLPGRGEFLGPEVHDVTLLQVAPEPYFDECYEMSGLYRRPGVYRIANWYWELEHVPPAWARLGRQVQEIWAPTRFIAAAMRRVMPVPVHDLLPGVELEPAPSLPRARWNLPDDRFLFLFLFDMCSVMERKNPLGLIRAFRQAFRTDDRVALAIKVTKGEKDPSSMAQLQAAGAQAGVHILSGHFSRAETLGLINACDAYVSLHRSEGFGLTMAEAMLLAKPVIATGYSGNLDFMTADNSRLIDFKLIENTHQLPNYRKGCRWADPNLEETAHWLRWAYERPEDSKALGERAQREVRARLSLEAAGQRMAQRLAEIRRTTVRPTFALSA